MNQLIYARERFRQALLLLLLGRSIAGCSEDDPPPVYQAVPVAPRDIIVSVSAAGTVEPITTVEVKSKASGEIMELGVETGDAVSAGDLLVRIDPRVPRNALIQAEADREVARAQLANAQSEMRRAETLFATGSITEQAHESVGLEVAVARASLVRAERTLEDAKIAYEDTEVRAPISGVIIEKNVEAGTVISSATREVGGGTVLLLMADLDTVQVRTLIDETDIGKVLPGLDVTIMVNAYPDRAFRGRVLKIEPLAETRQNVTLFPALIRIGNREGLLKPGMSAEVEVHIGSRENVLAVPNAALRTARDVASAAEVLGLDAGGEWEGERRGPRGRGDTAGGSFLVFVLRGGAPQIAAVRTGLTDLDYCEVLDGLAERDTVLVLPSAGLIKSQQEWRDRISRVRGSGLPGLKRRDSSRSKTPGSR